MMSDNSEKGIKVINQIKKLLYNYDMALVYANGEITFRQANMKLYQNSKKKYDRVLFVSNKVDKEKFEIYQQELMKAKNEIVSSVNSILDRYNSKYKQVFIMKFFEEKTIDEIASSLGYSKRAIDDIIAKLKRDFIEIEL